MGQTLVKAVKSGDVLAVTDLIKQQTSSAQKEGKFNINAFDLEGYTLLHWAAKFGHADIVTVLLENGADVNATGLKIQATPLMKACKHGHNEVVAQLIQAHADINAADKFKQTALHRACFGGHTHVVEALIAAGAAVNWETVLLQTPLHWACGKGHEATARYLLEHGAAVNAVDTNGDTPLHRASVNGQRHIVRLLLDKPYEARARIRNKHGKTPLDMAAEVKQNELALMLQFLQAYTSQAPEEEEQAPERRTRSSTFNGQSKPSELSDLSGGSDKKKWRNTMRSTPSIKLGSIESGGMHLLREDSDAEVSAS